VHIQKEDMVLILILKLLIWGEYPFKREFLYRREFLTIFRKARAGELELESGLGQLASLSEINVDEVGVGGAKDFFEAKVSIFGGRVLTPIIDISKRVVHTVLRKAFEFTDLVGF
jgi:hypothetical protein